MDAERRAGPWPLEPPEEVLREWFETTLEELFASLRTLDQDPAARVDGAVEEALALEEGITEGGTEAIPLLRTLIREYVPRSFLTTGPGYMAYIPGGGIVPAALADLISDVTNRFVGLAAAAPVLARLETLALRWLLDEMGYPAESRGVFLSGGSMANFTAVLCARHRVLGPRFQDGVVYLSDQAHHSMHKACRLAGFLDDHVRAVETDADGRLTVAAFERLVEEDRARGRRPAMLVGSAGTVNTGVVDPLSELGAAARRQGVWFHVDAAYGGFFQLTERGRQRFRGLSDADSITVDPHKGLFLPYGTGALLVRNGEDLRDPHASSAEYLPAAQEDGRIQDFCEYSVELSRDFRGLRVWLPMKLFGAAAFRECLDEKLDLAAYVAEEVERIPGLTLLRRPDLSLVAFHVTEDPDQGLTRELMRRINASGRVWISGTRYRGREILRLCILSFRTHRDRVDEVLAILRREWRAMQAGG